MRDGNNKAFTHTHVVVPLSVYFEICKLTLPYYIIQTEIHTHLTHQLMRHPFSAVKLQSCSRTMLLKQETAHLVKNTTTRVSYYIIIILELGYYTQVNLILSTWKGENASVLFHTFFVGYQHFKLRIECQRHVLNVQCQLFRLFAAFITPIVIICTE